MPLSKEPEWGALLGTKPAGAEPSGARQPGRRSPAVLPPGPPRLLQRAGRCSGPEALTSIRKPLRQGLRFCLWILFPLFTVSLLKVTSSLRPCVQEFPVSLKWPRDAGKVVCCGRADSQSPSHRTGRLGPSVSPLTVPAPFHFQSKQLAPTLVSVDACRYSVFHASFSRKTPWHDHPDDRRIPGSQVESRGTAAETSRHPKRPDRPRSVHTLCLAPVTRVTLCSGQHGL